MGRTGRLRARAVRRLRRRAVCLVAGALWAVALAEPAASPPLWPAMAPRELSLHSELTAAIADRSRYLAVAASRSEPAPPDPPPIMWPADGPLTGWYGERRGLHRHPGLDIDGGTGDPVVAAAGGRVVSAGPSPAGYAGYGTMVIVAHGDGLTTIYAHLSAVGVRAGADVVPGQRIGSIGSTGSSTGSHLHFELRRGGVAVDPKAWLPGR